MIYHPGKTRVIRYSAQGRGNTCSASVDNSPHTIIAGSDAYSLNALFLAMLTMMHGRALILL
jgi:hypothetical protein